MSSAITLLVGPLAAVECRRALARGWLILVRVLAAMAVMGAALIVLWWWWFSQASDVDYRPYNLFRVGLVTVEGMMLTVALVLGPAVLAGSIAGEKERGVMALLLTTRATPRDIILGRLIGKLTQVAMVLLAGVPALVGLASLVGMGPGGLLVLLGLPAAVAVGGGGLAVLASTVSRRGRDALLAVYMLDVLFLITPLGRLLSWTSPVLDSLGTLNPFLCLSALAWQDRLIPALTSITLWLALGLLSAAAAAWRLRPASLRPLAGARLPGRKMRRWRVPPVDEKRPMLWKELFIERVGGLGVVGRWIGAILVLLLAGGSLILAGLIGWNVLAGTDPAVDRDIMTVAISGSSLFVACLIEWAVGLRAAVTISSERERGTWDALLTSPLEGSEIIRAKLWGSLHALRWLIAATLLAWTLALACGAMTPDDYARTLIGTGVVAVFMAAVGVRTSLAAGTATRAMAVTLGIWMGSYVVDFFLSWVLIGVVCVVVVLTAALATLGTFMPPSWLLGFGRMGFQVVSNGLYVLATVLLVADTRLRFDRIAGRITGGRVATTLDTLIHGKPADPWLPRPVVAEEEPELERVG